MPGTSRRVRCRLVTLLLIVAVAGVLFAWLANERNARVAQLTVQLKRNEERVRWAQQMQGLGYVPKATLNTEVKQRDDTRWRLTLLGASPES